MSEVNQPASSGIATVYPTVTPKKPKSRRKIGRPVKTRSQHAKLALIRGEPVRVVAKRYKIDPSYVYHLRKKLREQGLMPVPSGIQGLPKIKPKSKAPQPLYDAQWWQNNQDPEPKPSAWKRFKLWLFGSK